jgi:hypothetical protein
MTKHADDDPVTVGFDSSRNISFNGEGEELGVTWGQWRAMSEEQRNATISDFVFELIDVFVEDDEE